MSKDVEIGLDAVDSFECAWCKAGGCDRDEYTRPNDQIGGYDEDSGRPICQDCADAAKEV